MRFLRFTSAWKKALLVCILFVFSGIAHAQKPGAFLWADADGNSLIEVPDYSALATILSNPSADDTLYYQGHPQSRFRQELDGNGLIEVPDLSILLSWLTNDFSNRPGNPDQLALDETVFSLMPGDSVTLSAYALSPASQGAALRTGLGVIFKIDPSGTCTTAQIFGYDVAGGATVNIWRDNAAYHYTLKPGPPDNGRATVRVNSNGCGYGSVVKVEVYIPNDTEAGIVPGRFPDKLAASQLITVTVEDVIGPDTFITSYPDDPTNSRDATFEFICSEPGCTYECKMDSHDWQACSSPKAYSNENWTPTSLTDAPDGRSSHTAVWTGTEMIIWGGYNGSFLRTGGRYNPATDLWTATTTTNAPAAGSNHTAVWTGTEMIVWGGEYYSGGWHYLNTGGRYDPSTDSWTATAITNAPSLRSKHTAVWTGTVMIVWGGYPSTNTGGKYNPTTDSWTATITTNAPTARLLHTAVWTGNEMIVWGGYSNIYLNTGGRYNPSTDSWLATSTTNAPDGRDWHSAIWTGTEMIVWGGYVNDSPYELNTGGRYDPVSDSWTETSTSDAPSARDSHTAVWNGTEMIVWGGWDVSFYTNTGGRYNPGTDSWTAITTTNAPSGRYGHTAVWNGAEMIVWGGEDNTYDEVNDGGIYTIMQAGGLEEPIEGGHTFQVRAYDLAMNVDPTPAIYSWTIDLTHPNTSIDSFPDDPSNSSDPSFGFSCSETNCAYECIIDSGPWSACSSPKYYAGLSEGDHNFQVRAIDVAENVDQTPASYSWKIDTIDPNTNINSGPPDPTNSSSAVFTFSSNEPGCIFECNLDSTGWEPCDSPAAYELLLETVHTFEVRATDWAGNTDQTPASFTWTIDQTPPETTINSSPPDPDTHNFADFTFSCNETPCTFECNLDSGGWEACASPINYAGLSNATHTFQVRATDAIGNVDPSPANYSWTVNANPPDTFINSNPPDPDNDPGPGFEFNCSQANCTYECKLDTQAWTACTSPKGYHSTEYWTATTTANAPAARYNHRAVWTGSEMIVWGGYNGSNLNTGGRYNPVTGSWTATSTINAPSGRQHHSAVWTGNEMIIWGGGSKLNTGSRYNPSTDSWATTTSTNAPVGRTYQTTVWTGSRMIIWGGSAGSGNGTNTGGIYNPYTDSWSPTSTGTNVPAGRWNHSAIWTGDQMIIWGGDGVPVTTNTGGIYNPSSGTWIATTTTNAPLARDSHNAVWTGSLMIVWGGVSSSDERYNTGGRYDPSADSWSPTSTINAPSARSFFGARGAIWTGTEMIIWGGDNGSLYPNDGGRYNHLDDSWTATTLTNAPSGRHGAEIIWTGRKIIVWGGYGGGILNTGGQYDPGYGNLAEGAHFFEVRAYGQSMDVDLTPASYTWTIDLTPPDTSINSYPPDPSNSPDAVFEFDCNEANCSFECKLDSGEWSACSSPKEYTGLSDGTRPFFVRAIDVAGNVDQTPATHIWQIDCSAPDTIIDNSPPNPSGSTSAYFAFSCNESNCTFECNLDSAGWEPCASPVNYVNLLPVVLHTFEVRATDIFEQTDSTPASFTWTIDITPPETSITSAPPDPSSYNCADFAFTCDEPPCTFVCLLDSTGWDTCTSPKHCASLENGSHTFKVFAYDLAGNMDSSPATYTWTIDLTEPETTITLVPPDPSDSPDATFEFNCSEPDCDFECQIDGYGWESCTSPWLYTDLLDGDHTFQVRATDAAGNLESPPVEYIWTIDTTP